MSINMENRTLFTVAYCVDKPGAEAAEERQKYMQGHLDHVASLVDEILVAGPMFADDKKTVVGSILIYKTDDVATARKYLEGDPYFKANIWESVSINTFRGALGESVGGIAY